MVAISHAVRESVMPGQLTHPRTAQRFHYQVREGRSVKEVIVDIDADGEEEWAEQYSGELRWYAYRPSPAERAMVLRWQATGQAPHEWPFRRVAR